MSNTSLFDPIEVDPSENLYEINTGVPSFENDLIKLYEINKEVPPTQSEEFDNLSNDALINSLEELYSYLIELLIRFDSSPDFYKKSDFKVLVKTIVNSLIYLYRYLPNLVRLLVAFVDLENDEELTIVKKLTVSKEIVGKIITSKEGFIKEGSSDEEVLLGGGGTKTLQSIYDISAGVVKEYSDYTLDLLEQTIVVKNEVDELKSETQQIKVDTEQIKSQTQQIKVDTQQIKSQTQQIKVDTQQIKSDVQSTANYLEQLAEDIGLGSPKGVYDTLDDLLYDDPDNQYIYVVLDTGNWYYWGNTEWKSGGLYQAPIDGDKVERIIQDIKDIQDSKVYLSESEYQILVDNNNVDPNIEYNIYEDDN